MLLSSREYSERDAAAVCEGRIARRSPTPALASLWGRLRCRRLGGHRFRRQSPIRGYVVDFYCPQARVAVEVAGGEARAGQDDALGEVGVLTVRVTEGEVLARCDEVLLLVEMAVSARLKAGVRPFTGGGPEAQSRYRLRNKVLRLPKNTLRVESEYPF